YNKTNWVFSFLAKAPADSVTTNDVTALDQLALWKIYQDHWCEHKPSITVFVAENEWLAVGAWVFEHINEISGVSFLPQDTGSYRQAPFEEVSPDKYIELAKTAVKHIDMDWT